MVDLRPYCTQFNIFSILDAVEGLYFFIGTWVGVERY